MVLPRRNPRVVFDKNRERCRKEPTRSRYSPARRSTTVLTAREQRPCLYGLTCRQVLVDGGSLLALFNRSYKWHTTIVEWLSVNPKIKLITTWCVLTEVCTMLSKRVHNDAALDVLRWALRGGITVDGAPQESLISLLTICERFADSPFDLADASIAEAVERMRIRRMQSIDSDFDFYWDLAGRALQNVLAQ
jgi:uncharacterized protein